MVHSETEIRFVCDEMLQGMGRWLRAAGYDTLIADNGEPDAELLRLARKEGRYFLTRDRKLPLEYKGYGDVVVLLLANDLPNCVAELSGLIKINWLLAPFSRCLLCNQRLVAVGPDQQGQVTGFVPEDVWANGQPVLYCPVCRKAYWEGSHVRRMRHRLEAFAKGHWV